ncbi:hypothetical protein K438DRAFT_521882 [Mycena galopus ATCC 62051]|nr:hypothetical protein K438DRAFT_521882 [Mycena galopus ATCC 62051]
MSSINAGDLFGSPALVSVENQVKALIAAAEANIERLTAKIRELNSRRDRERSILATLRLMVVPIGKLPTELLVEIFKLAVKTPFLLIDGTLGMDCASSARASLRDLLRLSQVSSYWRQIIHNMPPLWAQGFVEICLDRDRLEYLDGLNTVLTRSNPFPISISLVRTPKDSTRSESALTIARMAATTAHRWKNLSIELSSFHPFEEAQPEPFEVLERLYIEDFSQQKDPVVAFQSSPRLWNFTLYSGSTVSTIHLFHLPWSQLTHLDVDDMSLGGCRAVLLQCTHLVSGTFSTSYAWDSPFPATESPVATLPRLQHLTLTFNGIAPNEIHGLEAFVMPLTLPSLKSLRLEFHGREAEFWPIDTFSGFQRRCPNIKKITLFLSTIPSEGLIALLRNGRALTTLNIENCSQCVDQQFLNALRYDVADPAPLAPKLKNISLEYVRDDFEDSVLEAAIRSRWWGDGVSNGSPPRVSRLRSVSVSRHDYDDDESFREGLKARMQDMVDQGLRLDVA